MLGEVYSSVRSPAGNLSEGSLTQRPSHGRRELTETAGKGRGEEVGMVLAPPRPAPDIARGPARLGLASASLRC